MEKELLEIYRYVPPAVLSQYDINQIDIDCFSELYAKALYIQKVERENIAMAISMVFGDE